MTTHIDPYSMENKKNFETTNQIEIGPILLQFDPSWIGDLMILHAPLKFWVPYVQWFKQSQIVAWCQLKGMRLFCHWWVGAFEPQKKMKVKHDHHRPPVQNVQYELFITYLKSQELLKPPTNWLCTKQKPQNCTCNWVIALLIWQVGVGAHVPLASC